MFGNISEGELDIIIALIVILVYFFVLLLMIAILRWAFLIKPRLRCLKSIEEELKELNKTNKEIKVVLTLKEKDKDS